MVARLQEELRTELVAVRAPRATQASPRCARLAQEANASLLKLWCKDDVSLVSVKASMAPLLAKAPVPDADVVWQGPHLGNHFSIRFNGADELAARAKSMTGVVERECGVLWSECIVCSVAHTLRCAAATQWASEPSVWQDVSVTALSKLAPVVDDCVERVPQRLKAFMSSDMRFARCDRALRLPMWEGVCDTPWRRSTPRGSMRS